MKTKRKLVPKSTAKSGSQCTGDGNVGVRDLRKDVYGSSSVSPKRQCIHQADSMLRSDPQLHMSGTPAAMCCQQRMQLASIRNVNVPSIGNCRPHVGEERHAGDSSLLDWQACLGVQQPTTHVFSTWMAFGGNTRDFGSFGEETDKITDLHQILEEVLLTERGDGVTSIKRCRRDLSGDGV
ncbi:hypothetical protein Tco_0558369 [Tanacetum coccineum]